MATHAGGLIQDQNLQVHHDGAPIGKANVSKTQKKGGLGGRKALNDISNSGKPSALQASKKHNALNVTSIKEDLGASKIKTFGGKASKASEKVTGGNRKALSDLTNSGKPSVQQVLRKSHDKLLGAVAEDENLPSAIAEERFLHNHEECIKAQRRPMDMDCFLKIVGLHDDTSVQLVSSCALPQSRKSKPESPLKDQQMEEMPEVLIGDQSPKSRKTELPSRFDSPPPCGSQESPKRYMHWQDYRDPNFLLLDSP